MYRAACSIGQLLLPASQQELSMSLGGSASELSEDGRRLLNRFQAYQKDAQEYARTQYAAYFDGLIL